MGPEQIGSDLQGRNSLLAANGWEVIEEAFERIAGGQVVEQVLHEHAGARKDRCTAHHLRVDRDDRF